MADYLIDLTGDDSVEQARAMREGDIGLLPSGSPVVKKGGTFISAEEQDLIHKGLHKYFRRWRGAKGRWYYDYNEHGQKKVAREEAHADRHDADRGAGGHPTHAHTAAHYADHMPSYSGTDHLKRAVDTLKAGGKISRAHAAAAADELDLHHNETVTGKRGKTSIKNKPKGGARGQAVSEHFQGMLRSMGSGEGDHTVPSVQAIDAALKGRDIKTASGKYETAQALNAMFGADSRFHDELGPNTPKYTSRKALAQAIQSGIARRKNRSRKSMDYTDLSGDDALAKARDMPEGAYGRLGDGTLVQKESGVVHPVLDMNGELMKAGGPFIGPRGGKYADAARTKPWREGSGGGGGGKPKAGGEHTALGKHMYAVIPSLSDTEHVGHVASALIDGHSVPKKRIGQAAAELDHHLNSLAETDDITDSELGQGMAIQRKLAGMAKSETGPPVGTPTTFRMGACTYSDPQTDYAIGARDGHTILKPPARDEPDQLAPGPDAQPARLQGRLVAPNHGILAALK